MLQRISGAIVIFIPSSHFFNVRHQDSVCKNQIRVHFNEPSINKELVEFDFGKSLNGGGFTTSEDVNVVQFLYILFTTSSDRSITAIK